MQYFELQQQTSAVTSCAARCCINPTRCAPFTPVCCARTFAFRLYETPRPSACTRLQEVEGLKAALQNAEERISGLRTDYEQANSKAQVSLVHTLRITALWNSGQLQCGFDVCL